MTNRRWRPKPARSGVVRRPTWVGLALALLAAAPLFGQTLNGPIEQLLAHSDLADSRVGVMIRDADTGETLADIDADDPFIPASNMKLLTSAAALLALGPDFIFRTEIRREGGAVIVLGAGDPALGDFEILEEMGVGVEDLLDAWVQAIGKSGDGPIEEVIVDDRVFDDQRRHPSWPLDDLNRWYQAEVSGANFHANVVLFYVAPTNPGQAPETTIEPAAPWLIVRNRARTTTRGRNSIWVGRPLGGNRMTLYGKVRRAATAPIEVSLHDPAEFLGRLLADRLRRADLGRPVARRAEPGETLPEGHLVAVVETPMDVALRRCNISSHNLYAECLLKRLGHEVSGMPGSWANSAAVVRMLLHERLGPRDASDLILADGSGLSRNNRVTPGMLARWLDSLLDAEHVREEFLASLPTAGEGTLRKRFRDGAPQAVVRAKSGYIDGVSCLSGYLRHESTGRRLTFSVLVNDIPADVPIRRVKAFHERVVLLADQWLAEQDAAPALEAAAQGGG